MYGIKHHQTKRLNYTWSVMEHGIYPQMARAACLFKEKMIEHDHQLMDLVLP